MPEPGAPEKGVLAELLRVKSRKQFKRTRTTSSATPDMFSSGVSRGLAPRRGQQSGAAVADLLFSSLIQKSYCRTFLPPTTRIVSAAQEKLIRRKGEVEQVRAQCTLLQQKRITKNKAAIQKNDKSDPEATTDDQRVATDEAGNLVQASPVG